MENENKKNDSLHTKAIITLVLGIVSLACLLFGWLSVVGLGCGIAAIILGKKVKEESDNKESYGNAGFICGLIGTILSAIETVILIIAFAVFGITFGTAVNNPDKAAGIFQKFVDTVDKSNEKSANKAIDTFDKMLDKMDEKMDEAMDEDDEEESTTSESKTTDSAELNNLKSQLQSKQNELASLKQKITDLSQQIASSAASGDASQAASLQSEITQLQVKISTLVSEISEIESKIAALQ